MRFCSERWCRWWARGAMKYKAGTEMGRLQCFQFGNHIKRPQGAIGSPSNTPGRLKLSVFYYVKPSCWNRLLNHASSPNGFISLNIHEAGLLMPLISQGTTTRSIWQWQAYIDLWGLWDNLHPEILRRRKQPFEEKKTTCGGNCARNNMDLNSTQIRCFNPSVTEWTLNESH